MRLAMVLLSLALTASASAPAEPDAVPLPQQNDCVTVDIPGAIPGIEAEKSGGDATDSVWLEPDGESIDAQEVTPDVDLKPPDCNSEVEPGDPCDGYG